MVGWVEANTLVRHQGRGGLPGQQAEAARNDPNTIISMYRVPPADEVSLLDFEEAALARLRVLKGLEFLRSQGRKDKELEAAIKQLLDKHLKAKGGKAASVLRDQVSHFALRLAYCTSDENRRWLLQHEADLFKHRFGCLCGPEKGEFLADCDLPYDVLEAEELRTMREPLAQVAVHVGGKHPKAAGVTLATLQDLEYRRIPFEKVPDLVAGRRVLLRGGDALVPSDLLGSVLSTTFRDHLSEALVMTAGRWAMSIAQRESQRLAPIIKSLSERNVTLEASASAQGREGSITLAQVPALAARHFPLCMQQLYGALQADRHLKHAGRMQLSLFLKRAGLSLDESLLFWRTAFAPRTSSEKFQKEYAYNVRHSYGREGSRKDYEAQNCLKIIGAAPGVGEAHGCPFKTLNAAGLRAAMSRCGVKPDLAAQAVSKAQEGHFQVACARTFEGLFGEAPDAGVTHPNSYLAEALETSARHAAAAATPGGATVATPSAPQSASSPALSAATATGLIATPTLPFMRTPVAAGASAAPAVSAATVAASPLLGPHARASESTPTASGGGITPVIPQLADSPIVGLQQNNRAP